MGSKVRARLSTRRALVVIVGVAFALGWVVPSYGASAFKLAVKALGRANTAVHDSALAVNTSNNANSTANTANGTANAAKSAANTAQSSANAAQSTANTANAAASAAQTTANNARADFARMNQPCNTSSNCSIDHGHGVTQIRQTGTAGNYCVTATGRSPGGLSPASWLVQVDAGDIGTATGPEALPDSNVSGCTSGEFGVKVTVATGNANEVGFFVVIP